jgi:CubicO group peptidase (beta-lactamase class C family)
MLGAARVTVDHGNVPEECAMRTMMAVGTYLLMATLTQAAEPERAALWSFIAEPIRFEPFCFQGAKFPTCRFEHGEAVEKLIGPYTLKTSYYDALGRPAVAPGKDAGRYAAVVEIERRGRTSKRFFTLYHLQGTARWHVRAEGAELTLPRGTGIDPDLLAEQAEDIDEFATRTLSEALRSQPAGAALLAGLDDYTLLRRTGLAAEDDRASFRERQWWVDFRRRYYGYDKQFPKPFVCPRPVTGAPAPVSRAGAAADAGMKPDAARVLDETCAEWAKENGVGFAICVVCRGVVVLNKGYGEYDGEPVTTETPSILASLTKFLNALLLLELVDQGFLDLDDPVAKHIAALRDLRATRPITIRDLYLHTAGLKGHEGDTWPDLEEVVADLAPTLESGSKHEYQGMGHALGSKIMENVSGEALQYLYRNHLFLPLGCRQMRADRSSYGSWGTAEELARIGQMALNGGSYGDKRFFGPKTLAKIIPVSGKDHIGEDKTIRWGVGSKLQDGDGLGPRSFGHSGATGSFLFIDPDRELVIASARSNEGPSYQKFLEQRARVLRTIVGQVVTRDEKSK